MSDVTEQNENSPVFGGETSSPTTDENSALPVPLDVKPQRKQLTPEEQKAAHELLRKAQDLYSDATMLMFDQKDKTFYAMFLQKARKSWTDRVETAGVMITDRMELAINPEFWVKLTDVQRMEVLVHEVEHLMNLHPIRMRNGANKKAMNFAMDAMINAPLKSLHEFGITFDKLDNAIKDNATKLNRPYKNLMIRDGLTQENYEILMGELVDPNGSGDGEGMPQGGEVDDHGIWDESIQSEELGSAIVRDAANKTAAAMGIGNVPESVRNQLQLLNKSRVNWRQELRQFFANALKFKHTHTRSRRNRRTGLINPGRKKEPQLHIAICTDSSGSVSDDAFAQVFAEMAKIHEMGAKMTIIDADCVVQSVYEYDPVKHKIPVRTGAGGTAYQPAITHAKTLGVDGIAYFGDFDSADTPENPKLPFLWLGINTQSKPPGNFGKTIYVNTNDK